MVTGLHFGCNAWLYFLQIDLQTNCVTPFCPGTPLKKMSSGVAACFCFCSYMYQRATPPGRVPFIIIFFMPTNFAAKRGEICRAERRETIHAQRMHLVSPVILGPLSLSISLSLDEKATCVMSHNSLQTG